MGLVALGWAVITVPLALWWARRNIDRLEDDFRLFWVSAIVAALVIMIPIVILAIIN